MIENKHRENGFTIIEMLVVVAVIGLLSSVILTALGPARIKARDSRIIQEINQVRSLAETLYNGYNYDALESLPSFNIQNPDLKALSDDIAAQGGALSIVKSAPAPSKTYSAFSPLNQKGGDVQNPITQYYCIDSAGHSLTLDSPPLGPVCR
jgi:prepilin-type N-terminal cleavage/methylation domain-containing protein